MFILTSYYTTPDKDEYTVVGAYKSKRIAQLYMKEELSKVKEKFTYDKWEDDYCYEDDDCISIGFSAKDMFESDTIFSWQIHSIDLNMEE